MLPVLLPALPEVLHPGSRESLQREASQALAQRQMLADARRQDAAVSRHARRAQPAAHSADVARARLKAHRQAASRPMARVLPLARPEARLLAQAQLWAPLRVAAVQLLVPQEAEAAQPSVEPAAAAALLPSVPQVAQP